jgi:hypothetical protein
MAKNLTLDVTQSADASNLGGVATLEAPATPMTAPAAPAAVKPKRVRKPRIQPTGDIKPVGARAGVLAADGTQDAAGKVAALDAATGLDLHDPTAMTHDQRSYLGHAANDVLTGVGLGNKSGGYGPYVRTVVIALLGVLLGKTASLKTGRRTVTKKEITQVSIRSVLCLANFQALALVALEEHLAGLKQDAAGDVLKARTKNEKLAKSWITTGMHATYVKAIDTRGGLGGQCNMGGGIILPFDTALQISFGRNLSAKDIHETNKAAMAGLKISMATAAPTTPAQPTVAPVVAPAPAPVVPAVVA